MLLRGAEECFLKLFSMEIAVVNEKPLQILAAAGRHLSIELR